MYRSYLPPFWQSRGRGVVATVVVVVVVGITPRHGPRIVYLPVPLVHSQR